MVRRIKERRGPRPTIGGPRYPKDLESQARRAKENEQSLSQQQFRDRRGVSDAVKIARAQAWAEWTNFCKHILKIDPDETILDLCRAPPKQAAATLQCQKFLKHYIESSERQRPTLGPEGVEMRNRDPENREQWTLGVENKGPRAKGPTFEISTWIGEVLTKEYNLTTRQKFEKYEATDEEILITIHTHRVSELQGVGAAHVKSVYGYVDIVLHQDCVAQQERKVPY
ncbi:hypothetical protein B0H63DRAFT_558915 [Podospora didyma]|uniref:Uncharacterized protein n=1 Tax=Podospora didyma TaxID=330526 RepID=A0AAE0NTI0_9PEZI|nr:hypothetical protein B0H63DRAFT_558915 [Podospora didyma]